MVYFSFSFGYFNSSCSMVFFSFKINDKNKINQKQIIEKYKKLGKLSSKEIVTSFILFLAAFYSF